MDELFDVSGKVAVVTGGSRGIGAMIAKGYLSRGVRVYITARKEAQLQEAQAELGQSGDCQAIRSDLSTLAGVEAFAAELAERESRLDILVNNAGASWGASLDSFPEQGWDKVMDLNVKSLFFLTQQCLPLLRAAAVDGQRARVINIGSINGLSNSHMPNYSYTASKAAVHHLTRHLASDLGPEGINVNAIAPGFFPSEMTAHLLPDEQALTANFPIRRLGNALDAAGTAVYLASRASEWMTGQVLTLDGGVVCAA